MALANSLKPSVSASTDYTLYQPASGKKAVVLGLFVSNYDASDSATLEVRIDNSSDVLQAYLLKGTLAAGKILNLDKGAIMVLQDQQKLVVKSSEPNTSFALAYVELDAA